MSEDVPQASEPAPTPKLSKKEKRGLWWAETKGDLKWAAVVLIAAVLAGPMLFAMFGFGAEPWPAWSAPAAGEESLPAMTDAIFSPTGLLVPFEILSVLLLAALVAGVVIAFRDPEGGI